MKYEPHVHICIQLGHHPSDRDLAFDIMLPGMMHEASQPIDYPTQDAGIAALLCTPPSERRTREAQRDFLAKNLAQILADRIMRVLASADMTMGYKREASC